MKSNTPRRKRLNKKARLASTNDWFKIYTGKNLVKGYSNWFGVDWICALHELKLAGAAFTAEAEQRIAKEFGQRLEDKGRRKRKEVITDAAPVEYDEYFAFIAGYTPNEVPYGIPHGRDQGDETDSDLFFYDTTKRTTKYDCSHP
jgi:hypothetical protein